MHRFLIEPAAIHQNRVELQGNEARHLIKVLRLGPGDQVVVFDGAGREYAAEIISTDHSQVLLQITGEQIVSTEAAIEITLVQGLPKGDKLELIIQKATELGAVRIIPVSTERSVVKLDERRAMERRERWQRVALEASKQCRRQVVPKVSFVDSFSKVIQELPPGALAILPWEEEQARGIKEVLSSLIAPVERPIYVFIGPEGGFTPAEAATARVAGVIPVTLGPRILRTETAGPAVLAIIMYVLGDLGGV